ncbi:MAG TPA: hypothetical protein VGD99_15825 [Anaerolineae bacterium]|jgi:hypothetical protein
MPDLESIIEQMTLAEKMALCTGARAWIMVLVERLGMPEMLVAE